MPHDTPRHANTDNHSTRGQNHTTIGVPPPNTGTTQDLHKPQPRKSPHDPHPNHKNPRPPHYDPLHPKHACHNHPSPHQQTNQQHQPRHLPHPQHTHHPRPPHHHQNRPHPNTLQQPPHPKRPSETHTPHPKQKKYTPNQSHPTHNPQHPKDPTSHPHLETTHAPHPQQTYQTPPQTTPPDNHTHPHPIPMPTKGRPTQHTQALPATQRLHSLTLTPPRVLTYQPHIAVTHPTLTLGVSFADAHSTHPVLDSATPGQHAPTLHP